jgi:ribosome-associated toxin RatA of RatAB toxin-antitoxin module
MHTSNEIEIVGNVPEIAPQIYQLAADIQNWPTLLPHYRYLRILEQSETHKLADFGASRDGFPVKWRARQELFPEEHRITFSHVGGITKGMWVEWRLEKRSNSVYVTIEHELNYSVPVFGALFARYIVGDMFVSNIANKTLRCIKSKVEAEP